MKALELVNMEYGECVVMLGRARDILMVDCGSVSQKLREGDVPSDAGWRPWPAGMKDPWSGGSC